ncbi:arsenate reductase ArsC [Puniceicoccus vermicola]|uniref:Arsenate reductase ArsC n=1 Tax=Puniceicoccus vermicola TaxID=388746 RepID=A0A7X1AW29_9BACT|nr:arsenate reductase ArsC [Puniceicoccus vermicola]MBC2601058.1 arsenate reductase ArsC [Puniceicoccus vermicola]
MIPSKILILCTGNSCRSHMAEGFLREAAGDSMEVYSAGANPSGYVHPKAIAAMKEIGIDISGHTSKHLEEFLDTGINIVITVCDNAAEACPVFPGKVTRHHWSFPDPAEATGSEEEILAAFREIRDRIQMVFTAYADGFKDGQSA